MKAYITLIATFLIFGSNYTKAETAVKIIDRSAQEAVDEVKSAATKIIGKMKKNTNSSPDPVVDKKKDLKE